MVGKSLLIGLLADLATFLFLFLQSLNSFHHKSWRGTRDQRYMGKILSKAEELTLLVLSDDRYQNGFIGDFFHLLVVFWTYRRNIEVFGTHGYRYRKYQGNYQKFIDFEKSIYC